MPVIIGPTGLAGLFWPDGECAAARAAAAAGTAYCAQPWLGLHAGGHRRHAAPRRAGCRSSSTRDRGFTREMVERAAAAGYDALVLTIDNQLLGNRERDIRNGFTIPPRFGVAGTLAAALEGRWLLRMRTHPAAADLRQLRRARATAPTSARRQPHGRPARSRACPGPMSTGCARSGPGRCCSRASCIPARPPRRPARGVDGIIVSNHGGRQLDGAAASLDALPGVVAAVGGPHPGAGRRRHPARRRRGQGARARCRAAA